MAKKSNKMPIFIPNQPYPNSWMFCGPDKKNADETHKNFENQRKLALRKRS